MVLAPGPAAVFLIVPPGDKVALGETARWALFASSTPRMVFGGGDARRRLARKASRWTRVVRGLFLASLAAWPLRQPRARCLSSSLVPPQDRENCHIGGNVFVSFDGFAPVTLCNLYLHCAIKSLFLLYEKYDRGYMGHKEGYMPRICVKSPSRGRISAPAGVAPEALEECLCSSKGYKRCPTG